MGGGTVLHGYWGVYPIIHLLAFNGIFDYNLVVTGMSKNMKYTLTHPLLYEHVVTKYYLKL